MQLGAAAAAWLTVKVRPAMVSVPVRAAPLFAATVKPTDPFPEPLAPEVMLSHAAWLVALQVQLPPDAVTVTGVPLPPAAAVESLVGERENVQLAVGGVGGAGGRG